MAGSLRLFREDVLGNNMKRRQVLSTSPMLAVAGCLSGEKVGEDRRETPTESPTESPTPIAEDPNPWGKETLTVAVKQEATARQDLLNIVEQSLNYWDENSETFAGYDISFRFRPNSDDPDITVVLVDEIAECGEHVTGNYAGCAHVEHGSESFARVRIISGYDSEYTLEVLKHEFGHVLGLDHGDEPAVIMSDDIEDRIPDYSERNEILDTYVDAFDYISEGNTHWTNAMGHWENQEYADAEVEAIRAHDEYQEAANLFDEAAKISEEIGEADAVEICEVAYQDVEYMRLASDEAASMAREADRGNHDAAEEHRKAANSYVDKANQAEIAGSEDLADALGIPVRDD